MWTDGSSRDNQRKDLRIAGAGVFYGVGQQLNAGFPVRGEQTNQRAELTAVIECIRRDERKLLVCTDSQYVSQGITEWLAEWKALGWRREIDRRRTAPIDNIDLWKALDGLWSQAPPGHLSIKWVKGHANHKHVAASITNDLDAWGNLCADRAACEAADQAKQAHNAP